MIIKTNFHPDPRLPHRRLALPSLEIPIEPPIPAPAAGLEVIDNHIYFYTEVNDQSCLNLIKALQEVGGQLAQESRVRMFPMGTIPVWLHINSPGGDVFPALAAADHIAMGTTLVHSIVEGMCASAGTLLSMACQRRYIFPHGFMLIHQLRGDMWGTYEEMKDGMKLSEMLMGKLTDFYAGRSKLTREQIEAALQRDSWFDAAQAVEAGLVDGILRGDNGQS